MIIIILVMQYILLIKTSIIISMDECYNNEEEYTDGASSVMIYRYLIKNNETFFVKYFRVR